MKLPCDIDGLLLLLLLLILPWSAWPLSPTSRVAASSQRRSAVAMKSAASASKSTSTSSERRSPLQPPFPNGLCGGRMVTIPPEETFGIDVSLANINFGGDFILPPRPIEVWLPPDYQRDAKLRHPVLYVHDGQNAMDDKESWTGTSWRLMGALTRMSDRGLLASRCLPLVVLIPSQQGDLLPGIRRRHLEYGDTNVPFAQAHADLIANTVKPLIDSRFATCPKPTSTFAIGSSLGGQASLHLVLRHPDSFGGAACLSPAFGPDIADQVGRSKEILKGKRIYLDIGGDLNDVTVPWVDVLDHLTSDHWWNPGYFWLDTQLQNGVLSMKRALDRADADYRFVEFPGRRHNERAWAQRIHEPLLYLLGPRELN